MLAYNNILPGRCIILDGQPYEVLSSKTAKKSRQKASNQTKLKHLTSGKVMERAFHQSDNVEEADIAKMNIIYLYSNRGEYWFCEEGNPKARFVLPEEIVGEKAKFLKQNTAVEALRLDEVTLGINSPIKVDLVVKEAPPGIKGDTAQGGTKQVVLETGASVNAPLFINQGDTIRINTETEQYVERVEKA